MTYTVTDTNFNSPTSIIITSAYFNSETSVPWCVILINYNVNLEIFNNIEYLCPLECCCYDAFERVRSYVLFMGSMLDMCKAEQLVSNQFEAPYVINLFTDIP